MAKVVYNNMVYSSSYASVDKHVFSSRQVSISITSPQDFKGEYYRELNPPDDLKDGYKNGRITEIEFKERYYTEVLNKLDPIKVYNDLKGKVLCCWCSKRGFCHRKLVMEWLKNELGKDCVGGEL